MLSIRCMSSGLKQATPFKLQTRNKSRFHRGVQFFFKKNLFMTNIISCGICMGIADLIQQEHEYQQDYLPERYDWKRAGRMATVGMGKGPFHHFFYLHLDHKFPACNLRTVTIKIILDQICASPIIILYFFYAMGFLENKPVSETTAEVKKKYLYVYTGDWMYWPPVQFINFYFLPSQYRVLYINLATTVYNIFLSFAKHYDQRSVNPK